MNDVVDTVFGKFVSGSQERLELTYDYETAAIYSFKKILRHLNATYLLDVGANIGVYSIFCSDLPALKEIHAFEPAPASFELLTMNFQLQSNSSLLVAHRVAASSREGTVAFKIVSSLSGANSVVEGAGDGADLIHVRACNLDGMFTISDKCIGIKIDVEGHEASALSGMGSILRNNRCIIQIECLDGKKKDEVSGILSDCGYSYVFSLRDDHLFISNEFISETHAILKILSESLSVDLRDLLYLRRERRRRVRMKIEADTNPLFLPQEYDPFDLPRVLPFAGKADRPPSKAGTSIRSRTARWFEKLRRRR